jgi:hypothetical protein
MRQGRLSKSLTVQENSARHHRRAGGAEVRKYKWLHFWAARGLIHMIDQRDGSYKACSIREWADRAKSFSLMANNAGYSDERIQLLDMVDSMVACGKEAQRQGDPMNAKSRREVAHDKRYISYVAPVEKTAEPTSRLILPGDQGFQ